MAHAVKTGHLLNRSGYKIANWFRAATHSLTHRPVFSNLRIANNEGAKFWLSIMNNLKNRGLEDILI
ncbi:MAG: hypothetical protein ACI8R4_002299, partial [Paracoccaceae bacterium]